MAYATSTGSNITDYMTALHAFATANGWTAGVWTSATPVLFLNKGICHVQFQGYTSTTTTDFTTGSSVTVADHTLKCALSTATNTGLTTFLSNTGSIVTGVSDQDMVMLNRMNGPYVDWHFFTDATGDYIHSIIQVSPGEFRHLSFGILEQGGFTHSGVAYLTGHSPLWSQDTATVGTAVWNKPANQYYPFLWNTNGLAVNSSFSNPTRGHGGLFYAPDALPVVAGWPTTVFGAPSTLAITTAKSDATQWTSNAANLLDVVTGSRAPQWSGYVQMWSMPLIVINTTSSQTCHVGDYPDVRYLNMEGFVPGQEVTLGSDVWKIFPAIRQQGWGTAGTVNSSGHYAFAYKKI